MSDRCPFLPDEDDDNENSDGTYDHLLVLTNDSLAEVWNVTSVRGSHLVPPFHSLYPSLCVLQVIKEHGNGPFNATDELSGRKQIHEHGAVISDAALSPDGSALATASLDGKVRFFQVLCALLRFLRRPLPLVHFWPISLSCPFIRSTCLTRRALGACTNGRHIMDRRCRQSSSWTTIKSPHRTLSFGNTQ